jgi:hypothetical protein
MVRSKRDRAVVGWAALVFIFRVETLLIKLTSEVQTIHEM